MLAAIMGISPSAFGVIPRSGLGGSGERAGEAQQALTMSQKPIENFTAESINTLSRRFLGADKNITFQWNDSDDNATSMKDKASAFQVSLYSGQLTINDVRDENGQPPFAIPEADEPFILGAGGAPLFLKGLGETDDQGNFLGNKPKPEPPKPKEGDSNAPEAPSQVEDSQAKGSEGVGSGESEGQPSPPDVTDAKSQQDELKAFGNWVRSRKRLGDWDKDFSFNFQEPDVAKRLNDEAREKAGLAPHPLV